MSGLNVLFLRVLFSGEQDERVLSVVGNIYPVAWSNVYLQLDQTVSYFTMVPERSSPQQSDFGVNSRFANLDP